MREVALFSNVIPLRLREATLVIGIRLAIPCLVRLYEGKPFFGDMWSEHMICSMLIILHFLLSLQNSVFLLFGVVDFKRKYFYMRMLRSMLLPNKEKEFIYGNLFPSLNLLDP